MKQPAFWLKEKSILGKLLSPLGKVYESAVRRRFQKTHPYQPHIPVICVGNLNVGGTGKTPLCLALADVYLKQGKQVYFLNHGYKSKLQNVLVDVRTHTPQEVSDEALLLASKAPTIIDRNRGRGVAKAEKLGADLVIMDDGFQNPSVVKTLSIVVFDGRVGIGNGYCLPAGPLRESLAQGLKRADAAVIIGPDKTGLSALLRQHYPDIPVLRGHVEADQALKGITGIAFAGIGHPEKFFGMLKAAGVHLKEEIAFSDHHLYTDDEIQALLDKGLPLFTTTKDAVKIPEFKRSHMTVVEANFVFEETKKWQTVLEEIK